MSRQAVREVEYIEDGKLVKTVTDATTARAIGRYKDVYNKIESFNISAHLLPSKLQGYVRDVLIARSRRLRIVCIKEHPQNISEKHIDSKYECGILNTKTNEFERVEGGVELLYYKLFRGHVK